MIIDKIIDKDKYKMKRILGIDYGEKRVGLALSDLMHIIASPKDFLIRTENDFWSKILDFINKNNVGLIVIGKPFQSTDTKILEKIDSFIKELEKELIKNKNELDIITQDENFTSIKATEVMLNSGMKKKDRQKKENKDMISASIILKEFMEENLS